MLGSFWGRNVARPQKGQNVRARDGPEPQRVRSLNPFNSPLNHFNGPQSHKFTLRRNEDDRKAKAASSRGACGRGVCHLFRRHCSGVRSAGLPRPTELANTIHSVVPVITQEDRASDAQKMQERINAATELGRIALPPHQITDPAKAPPKPVGRPNLPPEAHQRPVAHREVLHASSSAATIRRNPATIAEKD